MRGRNLRARCLRRSRRCFKEIEAVDLVRDHVGKFGDAVAAVSKRLRRDWVRKRLSSKAATQSPLFQRD